MVLGFSKIGSEDKLLILIAVAYLLIQLLFFPSMYVSSDEQGYIKNATLLVNGTIFEPSAGYAARSSSYTDSGYVSGRFLGESIFLIPFSFFGLFGIMISGIFLHLFNFLIVALILKKLKVNKLFSILYLFFPAFLLASRTVLPGLLTLTFLLLGFYFFNSETKKIWLVSGLFFGLAVFTRYDAIFALLAFVIPSLFNHRKKAFFLLIGAAPIGGIILLSNFLLYGGALSTGYGSGTGLVFDLIKGVIDADNLIYFLILLIIYPLLIISPFISKFRFKKEFVLLIAFYFIINSTFTDFLAFNFSITGTLTSRLRYLVPLIGLLIIPYSFLLSEFAQKKKIEIKKTHFALVALLFLLAFAGASSMHGDFLNSRTEVFKTIQEVIPEGSTVIGSSDDSIYFQKYIFGDRKYFNVNLEQGLAGNPEKITLEQIKTNQTYILEIYYGIRVNRDSVRQNVVNSERQRIVDFINNNSNSLELVYENLERNSIRIYKWV